MLRAASGLRRLLVRLPTWVGDAVMATPALRALRATCPRAEIIAQGRPRLLDLLDGAGLYDRAIPTASGRSRTRANVQAIREVAPDAAILLPHSFRVAWETFRARVPLRLGYSRQGRVALLTDSIPPHRQSGRILPVPMAQEYLELAAVLGASGDGRGPRLAIPEDVRARGLEALERLGIGPTESFFTLNPGASVGPSKVSPVDAILTRKDAGA
ncbi:MAG: glycosyltransferase family 9 protein, partial [Planctomycetota bacterium]